MAEMAKSFVSVSTGGSAWTTNEATETVEALDRAAGMVCVFETAARPVFFIQKDAADSPIKTMKTTRPIPNCRWRGRFILLDETGATNSVGWPQWGQAMVSPAASAGNSR